MPEPTAAEKINETIAELEAQRDLAGTVVLLRTALEALHNVSPRDKVIEDAIDNLEARIQAIQKTCSHPAGWVRWTCNEGKDHKHADFCASWCELCHADLAVGEPLPGATP